MKKLFSCIIAALLMLSAVFPAAAHTGSGERLASSLNEALNVPGGTLEFETSADFPWEIYEDAARSTNEGMHSTISSVWTRVNANEGDVLAFDFWSMGENPEFFFDGLRLYVDGTIREEWGQCERWRSYYCELTAGEHEIRFSYEKDASDPADSLTPDCALVDNVYVGPVVLPESIDAAPVTVPVGGLARVELEVLPAIALDKSVAFTSADASVATVSERGIVAGVGVGTTTITVTSIAAPDVSASVAVTVTPDTGAALLEGYCLVDLDPWDSIERSFFEFSTNDPSVVQPVGSLPRDCYAAAYHDGNIYGYFYEYADGTVDSRFFVMDAETYELTFPGASAGVMINAMAYNYADETMYCIYGGNLLGTVELSTGSITERARLVGSEDEFINLAIDGEGNAFSLTLNSEGTTLLRVDLENGIAEKVAELGLGLNGGQGIVFDHKTNTLYWARMLDAYENGLYTIDTASGTASRIGTIGAAGMQVSCLISKTVPGEAELVPGDVNLNGTVEAEDAIIALRAALGIITLEGAARLAADMDGDANVTASDAILVLRAALGI